MSRHEITFDDEPDLIITIGYDRQQSEFFGSVMRNSEFVYNTLYECDLNERLMQPVMDAVESFIKKPLPVSAIANVWLDASRNIGNRYFRYSVRSTLDTNLYTYTVEEITL